MKKGRIGVQMYSLAPHKDPNFDAYECLAKLREIGYRCVEVSQVNMTEKNLKGFRRAIDELGFKIAATSVETAPNPMSLDGDLSNPKERKKMIEDARFLECDMFRIGAMPREARTDLAAAIDYAKQVDDLAWVLKEQGIDLYYHNHHFELCRYDGKFLLDILRDNTKQLGFELDTHWIHRGGVDPVKLIEQYAGRIRLLHLKDYRIASLEDQIDFRDIIQFAEVGAGTLDMPKCIEAGLRGGSEYFLVEQDDSYGKDIYDCLKISHDNLVKMGYGDWF